MNPNSMTNERLCALAQKGDEAARELLVEKNMGFIVQTADLIYRSSSLEGSDLNIDVDDLVQEGSIGLLRAVDGFDPARKLKFLTYAAPAIKNANGGHNEREHKTPKHNVAIMFEDTGRFDQNGEEAKADKTEVGSDRRSLAGRIALFFIDAVR